MIGHKIRNGVIGFVPDGRYDRYSGCGYATRDSFEVERPKVFD